MTRCWVDANVILRHLTQDPPDQAELVRQLFLSAQHGHLTLLVDMVTIAECVWVLSSVYGHDRGSIAGALADLVTAHGIRMDKPEIAVTALKLYESHGVDFVDALLAARMLFEGTTDVFSFDSDFDRLPGIVRRAPGDRSDQESRRDPR